MKNILIYKYFIFRYVSIMKFYWNTDIPITYLLSVLIHTIADKSLSELVRYTKFSNINSLAPHRKSMPVSDMEKEIIDNLTADPKLLFASHVTTGESPLIFLG